MYVVAIVGSRDFKNKTLLNNEMQKVLSIYPIKKVISGGAKGADTLGIQWARKNDIEAERLLLKSKMGFNPSSLTLPIKRRQLSQ